MDFIYHPWDTIKKKKEEKKKLEQKQQTKVVMQMNVQLLLK